jgi:hypothetical protein
VRKAALLLPLVLGLCASAQASGPTALTPPAPPSGIHAFLLRADEPETHVFPRTPAFAWAPVAKAASYEFQLATSKQFIEATLVWQSAGLRAPVAAPPMQLPWMTGHPYALWTRVRAISKTGATSAWSAPFGFNMRWATLPEQQSAPSGLIRWTPVDGATGYDVWWVDIPRHISTLTNVVDEREFWTLHPDRARMIRWRIRAVRYLDSPNLSNSLPRVSYGPYTDVLTTTNDNPVYASGSMRAREAISDTVSTATMPAAHGLTPGLAFAGTGGGDGLWRVYVSTDKECVNIVMKGSVIGSPAWAPRTSKPLMIPIPRIATSDYLDEGQQDSKLFVMYDQTEITPNDSGSAPAATAAPTGAAGTEAGTNGGGVELWDLGWPHGRYWWTVVAVLPDSKGYHDAELPQDACAAGRVWSFGKVTQPVLLSSSHPYVSGAAGNRVVAAADGATPRFRELPLIAWKPALGAQTYEVELSRTLYPWHAAKPQTTHATSVVLDLPKQDLGIWYYRVRGVNPNLPAGAQKMTWSRPVAVRITGDQFKVVK